MTYQAAILVGGKGTRLGALVADLPKPMLDVAGRPFLDHVLVWLAARGLSRVLLLCGHLGERIVDHFRAHPISGLELGFAAEPAPLGTAGAVLDALDRLDGRFLLLNGDSFVPADLAALTAAETHPKWAGSVALARLPDIGRYGAVELGKEGRIARFSEKGGGGPGYINAGIYRFDARALADFEGATSLERDVLPALAAQGRLYGAPAEGPFIDIGIPEDLARLRADPKHYLPAG